ncbi:MAG: hypothetical protein ACI8WB_005244 [Phenylobacterium sp.]|jgi:hypothetical protein
MTYMKIKTKLLSGYLMVATASVIVGFIGGTTTDQVKQAFDRLTEETIPVIETLEDIRFGGMELISSTSEYGFIKAEKEAAAANGKEKEKEKEKKKKKKDLPA